MEAIAKLFHQVDFLKGLGVNAADNVTPSSSVAPFIDHTLLRADATQNQIQALCEEAIQFGFHCVCINPYWVPLCADILASAKPLVCTVIGFPLGATASSVKVTEAQWCVDKGASELDMVINIGALKSQDYSAVQQDIQKVVKSVPTARVKVILETGLLSEEEKHIACQIAGEAQAHFVKTSTGFSGTGATLDDVKLMNIYVGNAMGVKASGGIRTYDQAVRFLEAGANRIGTSCGPQILKEGHLNTTSSL
ncbi:MAG: deoxyribose-phosphate aldolase [Bdellovibrionales bacterium]|nr:deoxyribose-phosphate aldolase [Bdellovibrionales bacterium]